VIDLHCHVLPGLDDGPPTMAETLALAARAEAAGISTLVATPHVSWEFPTRASAIATSVLRVNEELQRAGMRVTVCPGAEVALSYVGEVDRRDLAKLRIGRGDWLLVECPLTSSAGQFEIVLEALQRQGHRVILAHPERSPALMREPARLHELVRAGMLCSITAGSLVGRFGRPVWAFSRHLVEAGLVHNVASDAHDAVRRPPELREAVLTAASELPALGLQLEWLTQDLPLAVLEGRPAPPRPTGTPVVHGVAEVRRRHAVEMRRRGWLRR
jgi:protein-tyrosine phosphatase